MRDVETQEFQFLSTTFFPLKSFLLLSIYFLEQFLGSQENWEEGTEISHIPPVPTCTASPNTSIPHQSSTFATAESILTHHNHPKSIVYIRIRSWCCTFYGFGQMYNDMYPSLPHHAEYFHCPKNPLCSAY